ncbi:MAG: hypothetical protein ACKKMV_03060 [Candidatus Nealsonbacteria bacterium]
MKRIQNIPFAMVLVLSLIIVPAIIVMANGQSISGTVTLVTQGDSTAGWTNEDSIVDDYSAKLTMPNRNWYIEPISNAEAQINVEDIIMKDINGFTFYQKVNNVDLPICIEINLSGGKVIRGYGLNRTKFPGGDAPHTDWFQVDESDISFGGRSWNYYKNKYSDYVVESVVIGYGPIGSTQGVVAYIDDFTLNSTTYVFEPPPIPPDTTPPTITADIVVEPDIVLHGDTITVIATVTDDDSGVKAVSADFFYEEGGRPLPTSVAMYKVEGTTDQYKVEYIVPDTWNFGNMKITVVARDNSGNYIRSTDFHIVEVIPKKAEILQRNDIP